MIEPYRRSSLCEVWDHWQQSWAPESSRFPSWRRCSSQVTWASQHGDRTNTVTGYWILTQHKAADCHGASQVLLLKAFCSKNIVSFRYVKTHLDILNRSSLKTFVFSHLTQSRHRLISLEGNMPVFRLTESHVLRLIEDIGGTCLRLPWLYLLFPPDVLKLISYLEFPWVVRASWASVDKGSGSFG